MTALARLMKPFERLLGSLTDPKERDRTVAMLLIGYCAVWSIYAALAKGSQDIHFDMGEMAVWGREAGIGTPKHPPFGAWLVRGWFSTFPQTDAGYYLFAMVLATLSLWIAWRISENYLDGE
jgi:ABC-type branched-subunit amino acid transport system permease subunit